MFIPRFLVWAVAAVVAANPISAHEFWISPSTYIVDSGEQVQADLRVGENFRGSAYSYQPKQFERSEIVVDGAASPIDGRLGDVPALNIGTVDDGLLIVAHETTDNKLTYTVWAKFEKFVKHKDFATALEDHEAREISKERFVELYRRYAKSLIAVGNAAGNDKEVGLYTEIIARANPYTEDLTEMPVDVRLKGAPRPDAQVELFDRDPSGEVTVTLHRTDENGRAVFPVQPGHEYLVDAVALEALDNDHPENGPVWKTHWASLTFAVPEQPLK